MIESRSRDSTFGRGPWVTALVGVMLVVLVLLRQPHLHSWTTVWAEDGNVFSHDANDRFPLLVLFAGYAGYANLVPRLLAVPTAWIPAHDLALWLAIAGAAFDVALALAVARLARGIVTTAWLRAVLAVMTALAPLLTLEVAASITNVNWILYFAVFWTVVSVAETRGDRILRAGLVGIGTMSTPLVLLYAPLAVTLAAVRRRRADVEVLMAMAVGALVQLVAIHATQTTSLSGDSQLSDLPPIFAARVAGELVVGDRPLAWLWTEHRTALVVGAVALVTCVLALLALRNDRTGRWFAAVGIAQALVVFSAPIWVRGTNAIRLAAGTFNANGGRYLVAPILILFSVMVVLVDRQPVRILRTVLVAHSVFVIALSFTVAGTRARGPAYADALRDARARCATAGTAEQWIGISPGGWFFVLPCSRIAT